MVAAWSRPLQYLSINSVLYPRQGTAGNLPRSWLEGVLIKRSPLRGRYWKATVSTAEFLASYAAHQITVPTFVAITPTQCIARARDSAFRRLRVSTERRAAYELTKADKHRPQSFAVRSDMRERCGEGPGGRHLTFTGRHWLPRSDRDVRTRAHARVDAARGCGCTRWGNPCCDTRSLNSRLRAHQIR